MTDVDTANIDFWAEGVSKFQEIFQIGTSNVLLLIIFVFCMIIIILGVFSGIAILCKRGIR